MLQINNECNLTYVIVNIFADALKVQRKKKLINLFHRLFIDHNNDDDNDDGRVCKSEACD